MEDRRNEGCKSLEGKSNGYLRILVVYIYVLARIRRQRLYAKSAKSHLQDWIFPFLALSHFFYLSSPPSSPSLSPPPLSLPLIPTDSLTHSLILLALYIRQRNARRNGRKERSKTRVTDKAPSGRSWEPTVLSRSSFLAQ